MITLFSLLSVTAPISITLMLLVLAILSKRLGDVMRRRRIYRLFYVAALGSCLGIVGHLWQLSFSREDFKKLGGDEPVVLLYALPTAISVWLGLIVAWQYWSWLIYARDESER